MRDLIHLGTLEGRLTTGRLPLPNEILNKDIGKFIPDPKYGMSSAMLLPVNTGIIYVDAPATIDLLLWSPVGKLILAIYSNTELVGFCMNKKGIRDDCIDRLKSNLEERKALAMNSETMSTHADRELSKIFHNFKLSVDQKIRPQIDQIIRNRLFAGHPFGDSAFARLQRQGFYELYDTHGRTWQYAQFCAECACEREIDIDEAADLLAWASRAAAEFGHPIIERSGGKLLSAL
jgi:hypothetical protein